MRGSFRLFAAATALTTVTANSHPEWANVQSNDVRRLDEANSNYIDDFTSYNMHFAKCVRVKVPQNGDDDSEGNSYFYNGRYYAQYKPYASFFLCDKSDNDGDTCSACDSSKEYVTDLQTYLETTSEFVDNFCGACSANCRRRRLDDGDAYQNMDCSTCADKCSTYLENQNDDANTNEAAFLECQESYVDENSGIQYFSGPQCRSNGEIYIGLFYDDECTVKASVTLDTEFTYATFQMIEEMCIGCDESDGMCGDFYDEAYHCTNGYDKNGNDDDMPVCKTYKEASKVWTYNKKKKKYGRTVIPVFVLGFLIIGASTLGTYAYFIRHRERGTGPLSEQDHYELSASDLPAMS